MLNYAIWWRSVRLSGVNLNIEGFARKFVGVENDKSLFSWLRSRQDIEARKAEPSQKPAMVII
jgi:hypothetical protein